MVTIESDEQGEALKRVLRDFGDLGGVEISKATADGEIRVSHPTGTRSWRILKDGRSQSY